LRNSRSIIKESNLRNLCRTFATVFSPGKIFRLPLRTRQLTERQTDYMTAFQRRDVNTEFAVSVDFTRSKDSPHKGDIEYDNGYTWEAGTGDR